MIGALADSINNPTDLYNEIVKVTDETERGNWTSDLQCKVTEATSAVIKRYAYKHLVTTFHSAIDHTLWYEIPFAFAPWWSDPHKYT